MRYEKMKKGIFLQRPNRFIAHVRLEGQRDGFTVCHVKNTGRCRELLVPGTEVWVQMAENPARKTPCDLICVKQGTRLMNMDSQAPNCVAEEWLRKGNLFPKGTLIRREVRFGASRFDFYAEAGERRAFLEVKGVTLEDQGMTRFPDAPTQRGVRHVEELIRCMEEGYEAYLLFVIQMKGVLGVEPNDAAHPAFGEALRRAAAAGVKILAVDCRVTPEELQADQEVPVLLGANPSLQE